MNRKISILLKIKRKYLDILFLSKLINLDTNVYTSKAKIELHYKQLLEDYSIALDRITFTIHSRYKHIIECKIIFVYNETKEYMHYFELKFSVNTELKTYEIVNFSDAYIDMVS